VSVFQKLKIRLEMLNFSNLIYYNAQSNLEIKEFAKRVDNQYYK
jgi:hypothetical protein